jgi:hypothetical protein
MSFLRRVILPIVLAGVWVSASEFVRNELLFKSYWTGHYQGLGLVFPSEPVNGALWVVWSFLFAIAVFVVSRRFGLLATFLLGWLFAFPLMWIVIWNLAVLPTGLLYLAVPLSLLEAFIAALVCTRMSPRRAAS